MDDVRLLKVLREVALRGSFSAAAEALSYSQPAVSQQIARLEAQTGVKLLQRRHKGIKLTPAGEALVRHTERILAPLAVSAFRGVRPGVEVDLRLIDPPDSVPALRHGDLDVAIVEENGFAPELDLSGLGVERLMDDALYAALPADHPLATRRAIALGDLIHEHWMLV